MSGFYKRRRGILEHLEGGTISLLDLAVHDYLNLKANLVIGNGSSLPPGVCRTSAAAIHATCPSQISERAIQRSLEHLEKIGWIKRWNIRGKHGNYPVLVCRASVHDVSGKEYRVDGTKTSDWHNPILVPVGDLSSVREIADTLLSPDREVRREKGEKRNNIAAKKASPPTDVRFTTFKDFAFKAWEAKQGCKPTWGLSEYSCLAAFLKRNPGVSGPEMERRFATYLSKDDKFYSNSGYRLSIFLKNFDGLRVSTNGSSSRILTAAECRPEH